MGDVSARAGVSPFEAEQALQALAADAAGTLQVSTIGACIWGMDLDTRPCLQCMRMLPVATTHLADEQ